MRFILTFQKSKTDKHLRWLYKTRTQLTIDTFGRTVFIVYTLECSQFLIFFHFRDLHYKITYSILPTRPFKMFKMFATTMCLTTLALAVMGQASEHDDERQGRGACIIFNNNIIIITLKLLCFYVLHTYYNTSRSSIIWAVNFYFSFSFELKRPFRSLLFQDGIWWKEPNAHASGWTADQEFVWVKASAQKLTESQWAGVSRSILAVQVTMI